LSGGGDSLSHGALYGSWIGIFFGFGERWFDFAFGVITTLHDAIVNGILNIVFFVVLGILVIVVYGKFSSSGE